MRSIANIALYAILGLSPALAGDREEHIAASRDAAKTFGTRLKGELQQAVEASGAVNGIGVCNERAAEIAAATGAELNLRVGRTSLKVRNPDNSPDAWELAVLRQFEERKEAGEPVAELEFFEVVGEDGNETFRYMRAIPTATVCLGCHGESISPEISTALDELYPDDAARGFRKGDIRGAFTVAKPL